MPASLGPLRFEPFLRPMVWGGRDLETQLHKRLPAPESYGESWEVSDHALHHSVVAEGPRRGTTLRRLMEDERDALLGPAAARFTTFPWLIKFLDACDWLSVQVHPDAGAVKTLWPGEGSKTEAWYVVAAQPSSRIYAGLAPGIGPEQLRRAVAAGRVAECLHSFVPQPGDCVFLPAGTVHAVGGGVLFAEIQETSDATFRLFDWNRVDAAGKSRKLHIDEAFAAIHWDRGPVEPKRVSAGAAVPAGEGPRFPLVHCDEFLLDYVQAEAAINLGGGGAMQTLIVLEGHGRWESGAALTPGQVWVLPVSLPPTRCELALTLRGLMATLPS
ncbi:MAG: class I mannose-6-phosphate isomerase [Gemmataceae bacterium]|nr:class I mannose-6-phosphate isomerase [Gemmataceae bacterium]